MPPSVWIILITILYVIRDVGRLPVPDLVFSGLLGLSFILLPLEGALAVFAFSTPLTLPSNEVRLLYTLIFLLKINRHLKFPWKATLAVIGMLFLQLIDTYAYSNQGPVQYLYSFAIFALFIVIPLLWHGAGFSPEARLDAVKAYVTGIILAGVITIYMTISLWGWTVLLGGSNSLGRHLANYEAAGMVTSNNRNALGMNHVLALTFLLILLTKRNIRKVPALIGIILCIGVTILTRSRTAFVILGFVAAFWGLIVASNSGRRNSGIAILVVLVAALVAVRQFMPDMWNGVVSRFFDQEDISNGRLAINSFYFSAWASDWKCILFGYGAGTYSNMVQYSISPHNFVVDILICWGLTGFLLLLVFWWELLKSSGRHISKGNRKYAVIILLVNLLGLMMGQYLTIPLKHLQFCFTIFSLGMLDLSNCEKRFIRLS